MPHIKVLKPILGFILGFIFVAGLIQNCCNIEHTEFLGGNEDIKLSTMSDYDWYIGFANQDRLTFNVHSRPSIKLSNILWKIGHPEPKTGGIGKTTLNTLMSFALPERVNKISHLIQAEFKLDTSPKLLVASN